MPRSIRESLESQPLSGLVLAQAAVNKSEVILQVGAEGGAITLYGVRDPDGWRYSVLDQTPSLLPDEFDEPEIRKRF